MATSGKQDGNAATFYFQSAWYFNKVAKFKTQQLINSLILAI